MGDNFKNIKGIIINRSSIDTNKFKHKKKPKSSFEETSELKDYISRNKISEVIEILKSQYLQDKKKLNATILIESKFNLIKEQKKMGVLSLNEYNTEVARVADNLLELIDTE